MRSNIVADRLSRTLSWCLAIAVLATSTAACPSLAAVAEESPQEVHGEDALSEYTMGVFLLERGRPQQAVPHLEAAWRLSGGDEKIGNRLSEAYFRAGDLDSCERVLDRLLEQNEENDAALFLKARINYFRGDAERALQYLQKLRKSSTSTSPEVERLVARIQLELGRFDDALTAYENTVRLDPRDPVARFRYGVLLRKFDRRLEAEEAFRAAVRLQPVFSEAVIELAEMLIEEERFDEAETVLLALLGHDGDFSEALMLAANLLAERDKAEQAIELLEERAQRHAIPRAGVLLLGKLYYEVGDMDASLQAFRRLFSGDDKTAELARVLGELFMKTGQPDSALVYYRRAIDLEPDNYRNYLTLFFASSSRFNPEEAVVIELPADETSGLLRSAARIVPESDFDGFYILGVCYESLDDLAQAEKFFEMAVKLRPNDERALLNLASVLEQTGRYEEAEPHLVKLHELKPTDPTVCNFYGYLLALMKKKLDHAEELIRTALKQEPDNGYYVDSLGWVFYAKGEYEKAVVELERASRLVENDPVILEHLGDVYQSLKRFREALAAYRKSMDLQGENAKIIDKIDATRNLLSN